MVINEAGTYTLVYTATDECGNTTTVEREVVVSSSETYRTVLYTDGTLIINESSNDTEANVTEHGVATNVYDPLDADHPYVFTVDMEQHTADIPWFNELQSITSVEIGSTIHPTSTAMWFAGLGNCTSMDLSLMDTSNVTDMKYMFNYCQSLGSLDLSNFDTSNVTDMKYMFDHCAISGSLNLSTFDTSSVTDMQYMFEAMYASSIDLSNFNTSNVTDMSFMFWNLHLEQASIDVSSFNTSSVENMSSMFGNTNIQSLDLSNFVTSNVTNMRAMFAGNNSLTSVDVSSFDTSAVTNMRALFEDCRLLTSVDVSSFDTSAVTNMESMFSQCNALTTITASEDFVTTNVSESTYMFTGDTQLVGGNGTTYSASHTDKTYARIDTAGTPGYFTASA